jgi:hypothetical protein
MNIRIVGAVVAIVVVMIISAIFMTRSRPKEKIAVTKKTPRPPRPPATSAPTTAPATTAPATTTAVVYPDYAAGIIPSLPTPSFILIPGANFPGLTGKRRDEASIYIMTRYPRLVVRAIPLGTQLSYEVRSDRVTLAYDPYTNRIVTARVG